jgi:hypothetical protein
MMIGAFMPGDEPAVIRVAPAIENTRSVTDWLRARFDDLHVAERDIKPAPSPCYQDDWQGGACQKASGCCRRRWP